MKLDNKCFIIIIILIIFSGCIKMNEQNLIITDQTINKFNVLKYEKKFIKNIEKSYSGAPTEEIRLELENIINKLLDDLINNIKTNPKKSFVLNNFKNILKSCYNYDTEDREMICSYLEKIMDILEINSSDGILNKFMYGFDPK